MEAYQALAPETYANDLEFVNDKEREWSGIDNENVKSHKMAEYGLAPEASDKDFIREFLLERAKEKSREDPGKPQNSAASGTCPFSSLFLMRT
jgi:hypothetical protein